MSWSRFLAAAVFGAALCLSALPAGSFEPSKQEDLSPEAQQEFARQLQKAEAGDVVAMAWVGRAYWDSYGKKGTLDESLAWSLKAAETGNAAAMRQVAYYYAFPMKATNKTGENLYITWMEKAVAAGDKDAVYWLGVAHSGTGSIATANSEKAIYWLTRAADGGSVRAMNELGFTYHLKKSLVPRDFDRAMFWWRKAADHGDAYAMQTIAMQYRRGVDIPHSAVEAAFWFHKAADMGLPSAQYTLAIWLLDGRGFEHNPAEGAIWMQGNRVS